MEKLATVLITVIVWGLVYLGMLAYSVFSWGYTLYIFYGWFVEPVYVDIPHITLYQAFGLTLFLTLFKNNTSSKEYEGLEQKDKVSWIVSNLAMPWVILLSGWLVYSYIL